MISVSCVFCIFNALGAYLLLLQKTIGFGTICISTLLYSLTTGSFLTILFCILGLIILWFILNLKSEGVKYWDTLK